MRYWIELQGDRPVDTYQRGDVTAFMDTLRIIPTNYGRSPKDKNRPVSRAVAEAAEGQERLGERTVKRHLSAIAQFFRFAMDKGLISNTERVGLVEDHKFRKATKGAKEQRDAWTSEELKKLFSSPIWMGCKSAKRRTEPGSQIIKDARYWLPLLALYHGARLEEFADMRRKNIGNEAGIWFANISDDDRRLKNANASRVIPLHPRLLRLGFIEYVEKTAPAPEDALFPDLRSQGPDGRRGPRFTRDFIYYRKAIGLYREGVGMHAFRHVANTRLRDVIKDFQQERHVAYLLGHSQGGGEGRERYDKGPGLRAMAETLALLHYPEVTLLGVGERQQRGYVKNLEAPSV